MKKFAVVCIMVLSVAFQASADPEPSPWKQSQTVAEPPPTPWQVFLITLLYSGV